MKINISIVILITLFVPLSAYSASQSAISALQYASTEMNKQVPKMIDRDTELTSTYAYGDTLTYFNRLINVKKSELDISHFRETMIKQLSNNFCTNAGGKYFRDNDLKWKHNYNDKNDISITNITTSVSSCSK